MDRVTVRAISGFKNHGGPVLPGEEIEVDRAFAASLVHESKAEYVEGAPAPRKLSTKSAKALVEK